MTLPLPPRNIDELITRAEEIAGLTVAEVATSLAVPVPLNLKSNKGWLGLLIEKALGAQANNKACQDFPELAIELKTIPISATNKPLETTFVCLAPLTNNIGITWQVSHVRNKLSKVLWIPVEGDRQVALADRCIGRPIIWQANQQQEQQLRQDWEELMELILLGKINSINARLGKYLQLRPKAGNSREVTIAIDEQGKKIKVNPLGFYLRKEFTQQIIDNFSLGL